jgi:MYXO-CTERM domain-containing protein
MIATDSDVGDRAKLPVTLLIVLGLLGMGCERARCPTPAGPIAEQEPDAPERSVGEPDDEVAFLYDQAQLRTFELRLEEDDLAFLDANPAAEEYVPGTLIFDGTEYGPVGVRYKGSVGAFMGCTAGGNPFDPSGPKICPKINFKVSFNEYDPDGRFFGVKKLLFHAMNQDDSMMRERLGYWLFREMDVPAPRAVHVRVLVNGEYAGVFVNVEYIDGRFTRSHFDDGEGNLFKEVWPTASDLQPEVTEPWLLEHLRTNEDEDPSMEHMLAFSEAASHEDGNERAAAIQASMSVEHTMRFIAVDRTIRADDGPFHFYCPNFGEMDGSICMNHNYYLYEEANADRLYLIPWDLDNAFVVVRENGMNPDTFTTVLDEWDDHDVQCEAIPGMITELPLLQMPPSCDPLIAGLGCLFHKEYEAAVEELLDGPFHADTVEQRLAEWEAQIADAVDEAYVTDPEQLDPGRWQAGLADLQERNGILREQAEENIGCSVGVGAGSGSSAAAGLLVLLAAGLLARRRVADGLPPGRELMKTPRLG